MSQKNDTRAAVPFQAAVTVAGCALWLATLAHLLAAYPAREQLVILALVPLIVFVGLFTQHFRLPFGLDLTEERLTISLSDAIILLVAWWYGPFPAVFVAGVEGFVTSRRSVRRLSSNAFSLGMMSLAAGAGGAALTLLLGLGVGGAAAAAAQPAFYHVAVALFAASLAHSLINLGLLFTLLALRHGRPVLAAWREGFSWTAPILCLPTTAASVLMYDALEHGPLAVVMIGAPTLAAIHLVQRQNRRGVQQRLAAVEKAHRETIEALAVAINAKDQVTHDHVLRVQIYAAGVARLLGCTPAEIEALKAGALLHDIGKIAVPDYILNKPGKLTADEFERMKIHTTVGAQILGRVDFPYPVTPVVRHHHERWDGKGYPDGLKGELIPLTARILSVVDCFDAVREDRQYRRGLTREEAVSLIMQGSGTQYDPRVVGTFVTHLPTFEAEIQAARGTVLPTFGIEPTEQLSEAARAVAPAAGLASDEDGDAGKLSERDLSALRDLAAALEPARPDAARIAETFLARLVRLVPSDTSAVTLPVRGGGYEVAHAEGAHARLLRGRAVSPNDGVTGWVLANRTPFCNVDPRLDFPEELAPHFSGYRTLAALPLTHGDETLGALTLYSSALAEYSAGHRRLLEVAAAVLASALSPAARATPEIKITHPSLHDAATPVRLVEGGDLKLLPASIESELTH